MKVPFEKVLEKAQAYKADMVKFLRDMVAIPSESCEEKDVVLRIKEEMEKVGFDKVVIDPMGNILGYIGHGKHLIGMDAHIDTVGIGEIKNWTFDPYKGFEDDVHIGGRGTSDQEGGMASMVYAAKIIKDLGLEDDYTLVITGKKIKSDQNSSFLLNQPAVEFIVDIEEEWKSKFPLEVSLVTVVLLKEGTTPSIRWHQSLSKLKNSMKKDLLMTHS